MNLLELKTLIREEVNKALVPHLEKIKPNEIEAVLNVGDEAFETPSGLSNSVSNHPNYNFRKDADYNTSIKMVLGNKIIGYYLLSDKKATGDFLEEIKKYFTIKINDKELFSYIENNKGVQGLTVGILPEYQGKGYSKLLFNYPKSTGYNYIWAIQTKGMSDLDGWLKRAQLLLTLTGYGQTFYITVEKF